jgi:predicted CopG family antitoxin
MKTLRDYKKETFLGKCNGENIYLSAPSWDCGWYWGFGYLGNKNCHYHVDGIDRDKNLHDAFLEHFDVGTFVVSESDLWQFCELFETFYTLKKTAEVLGRGGSHYSKNPCEDIIKNSEEAERINQFVLPAIFDAIYDILDRANK